MLGALQKGPTHQEVHQDRRAVSSFMHAVPSFSFIGVNDIHLLLTLRASTTASQLQNIGGRKRSDLHGDAAPSSGRSINCICSCAGELSLASDRLVCSLIFYSCKAQRNLNCFFAIIMGLNTAAVSRLGQTWEVRMCFSQSFHLC